ncbi:MAG TPA: glycosyltransferase [Thermoanaerobaculia bacterium]|jgi:hypothetical protein|nr:glycosyltransferase [Thermoanaerobaculia bacterium]
MSEPHIAVLIPVHGALPCLEECLRSLTQVRDRTPYRLVLIDDGTPGGLGDLPARFPVDVLLTRPGQGGFTAAVNEGLSAVFPEHEACVLLNSDMQVLPGWLDALVARWRCESRVGLVGGMELDPEDPDRIVCGGSRPLFARGELTSLLRLDRTSSLRAGELQRPEPLEWVSFGIALVVRDVWEEVGELDPRFRNYFSDTDYGGRANLAGFGVWYEPASRVLHRRHQSTRLMEGPGLMRLQADRESYCRKWFPGGLPIGRDERRWAVRGMKSRRAWRPRLIPHLDRLTPLNGLVRPRLLADAAVRRDVETALAAEGRLDLGYDELEAYRRLYTRGLAFIDFLDVAPPQTPLAAAGPVEVFAPHADDAALSVGGLLLAQRQAGVPVRVHVLFGRSGHSTGLLAGLDVAKTSFVRAFEEAAWCAKAGAAFTVEPLPDRLVRQPAASIFLRAPEEVEEELVGPVVAAMESRLAGYGSELPLLLAPLAAGLMADHAVVARAATVLLARGYPPDRVLVYDDLPYATQPRAVRSGLDLYARQGVTLRPRPMDVTPWFDEKTELLGLYASQMDDGFLCAVEQAGQAPFSGHSTRRSRSERLWSVEAGHGRAAG